jgi:hypothetical protein
MQKLAAILWHRLAYCAIDVLVINYHIEARKRKGWNIIATRRAISCTPSLLYPLSLTNNYAMHRFLALQVLLPL